MSYDYEYECVDSDGQIWPDHDTDRYSVECPRCGAEMDPDLP